MLALFLLKHMSHGILSLPDMTIWAEELDDLNRVPLILSPAEYQVRPPISYFL
jgi:hypothetical protein